MSKHTKIKAIHQQWRTDWTAAKKTWSNYIKLREPLWCFLTKDARLAGLTGSFAMIRLTDHRIVIDLEQIYHLELGDYGLQILAHEIGHHIYTPANLYDNALLLSRIRWVMAGMEDRAPMVANIYEDLLINDRLQRTKELDMISIFQQLNKETTFSKFWMLYMRTYEYLWRLKRGTLAIDKKFASPVIDADASLIASLIRSYAKNWLDGGGRFAAMLYPYLMEEEDYDKSRVSVRVLLDAEAAGKDAGVISGLTQIDLDGIAGAIDPRTEALQQEGKDLTGQEVMAITLGINLAGGNGPEQRYLNPGVYIDLQQQLNPNIDKQKLVNNYYKEVALPHLIEFPVEDKKPTGLTSMEGTEEWNVSDPVEQIDWLETAIYSPQIIPGYNTLRRIYTPDNDGEKEQAPLDIYIGVDCSGSMRNPVRNFSWPILAASIIGLSALRAGAKVMGCLSGEPGSYLETKGFSSSEEEVLTVLTSYLGTGYAFGINRLKKPFEQPLETKAHIVLVSDDDIFAMLNGRNLREPSDHWALIKTALEHAGGEGIIVLHSKEDWHPEEVQRLREMGWQLFYVTNEAELLTFAAAFAKEKYKQ